ncbi:DUF2140 family protein [Aliicoccus persicus]|uniref:DUF2140 family protein n=1 Tax=Aliicoccus persicus TaxID=930138 RepID=A0A662Z0S0_9STAP|nr:DUF2140 family protein [Aliicoccus persicus]SEV83189.1 Uncharacterized protein YpmS [Aliicoccus persicus]HJE19673.1 DUF2140 family protein [Aliicoccus persicus]
MNIWKYLFVILLVINVAVVGYIYYLLSGNYEVPEAREQTFAPTGIEFILDNSTIQNILDEAIVDDNLSITVTNEDIEVRSVNTIYGNEVVTTFNLEPLTYGEYVTFRVQNIDIAGFPLSQDMLYTMIIENSSLPEGIQFSREQYALIFDTDLITNNLVVNDLNLVNIDYENNAWYFNMNYY